MTALHNPATHSFGCVMMYGPLIGLCNIRQRLMHRQRMEYLHHQGSSSYELPSSCFRNLAYTDSRYPIDA
jgi:hypothetical protein